MRGKRIAALLLTICVLLCGCGKHSGTVDGNTPAASQPDAAPMSPVVAADVQILSLQKQWNHLSELEGDTLLVQSGYSYVTLWFEDAASYPALAQVLEQSASMIQRSMEDEFDNLCAIAYENLFAADDSHDPFFTTLDVQVRRADSVAVSLLSDSRRDDGLIEEFRGMYGTNYDTQTGEELALSDVVDVNNDLAEAVADELNSHQWAGDFDYRDAVEAYFANTPCDDISWTLDYNGVTFYFADGELTEAGNGRETATVTFAEYPELFEEKYTAVPDGYMVELPMDSSYFTDLDGDGDLEEVNITGWHDTEAEAYTQFGIYADADGSYQYEECSADAFVPYYVKTADGGHYLYLFCREGEGEIPLFTLQVFDISGGSVHGIGAVCAGPGYIPTNGFRVLTDPKQFYLDDFEAMAQDMTVFAVGASGMPESEEDSYDALPVFDPETMESTTVEEEFFHDNTWYGYALVNPESAETVMLPYEEEDGTYVSVALQLYEDGTGRYESGNEGSKITWSPTEDLRVCITFEDGRNYYITPFTMGGESYIWLLMEREDSMVWLY